MGLTRPCLGLDIYLFAGGPVNAMQHALLNFCIDDIRISGFSSGLVSVSTQDLKPVCIPDAMHIICS